MKAFLLLCLVGIVGAFDSKLDSTWNFWKAQFNRVYTEEAELYRRELWENTVAFIAQHNLEADLGMHSYEVGLNQFADWTDEEYQALLGYRAPEQLNMTDIDAETYEAPENEPLPNAIDWRQRGAVTGVKNQGSCGSCWAFSSTGGLEGQNFKKTGRLVSLSEQQLVDCTAAYGNKGCQGGWMNPSFTYVQRNGGINTQACYPYTGRQGTCHPNPSATCRGGTSAGFANVGRSDAALQSALGTVGPISVAIDAGKPGFKNYRSGVYNDPSCSKTQLNHAVLAVGFQPTYYIVKNSWGTSWGAAGYINMATNVNICGITNSASYPRV